LRAARERPEVYARVAHGLVPAPHHRRWLEALREAVETPGGRLLLVAPPGSAKSTVVSLVLALWYLGRWPDRAILAVTSSDSMAGQFHGVVELALRTNAARRAVFPEDEALPAPARGWSRDGLFLRGVPDGVKDPSYRCIGFGTKIVGTRSHLLLLDDPVDQATSLSAVEMLTVRRELDNVLLPRLHPEGSAIAITTRWAEEDVGAHLLAQGWRLVATPALGDYHWLTSGERDPETGEGSLWPARWSLEWLLAERRRLGGAQWSTVWMGDPVAVGAGVFGDASWFRPLPEHFLEQIAPGAVRMTFVDTAFSAGAAADYTVALTLAYDPRDPQRRTYLTGLFRKRITEDGLADALAEHLLQVRPHAVGVELPAFRQEAVGGLVLALRARLLGRLAVDVQGLPVSTDKVVRARLPAARAEAGLLHVDKQLPLWPVAERELLGFPAAAHDDVVDALSGAMVMCLGPAAGRVRASPAPARFG
jgi:predicted phage terminase large subunit-like protein